MTTPPPPLPPRPRREGAPGAGAGTSGAGAWGAGASRSAVPATSGRGGGPGLAARAGRSGDVASVLPLALGGAAFVISLVLAFVEGADARASDLGIATLPVIEPRLWWVALLGYLLTPIVVIVASGLDRLWQRAGLRDRRFTPRPLYSTVLTWLVRVGFVLALWHIVNLAAAISDFWSNR
ncbi:hypothetical protein B7R23_06180 [Subtercola boreus]|nr:hypothetical protein B7R24_06235 [Subtercola boreus]RFA21389.1 hypothetical protein B7R23_06180 [Subtercola boreus]